jgi:hypothetical protein
LHRSNDVPTGAVIDEAPDPEDPGVIKQSS